MSCAAALALDGALQAARQLQVPHDETLLLQIHVIVAERSNEVAMVVALLRLCSTLLLLQIVELKDAIGKGLASWQCAPTPLTTTPGFW